jgi:hypothetical protein
VRRGTDSERPDSCLFTERWKADLECDARDHRNQIGVANNEWSVEETEVEDNNADLVMGLFARFASKRWRLRESTAE